MAAKYLNACCLINLNDLDEAQKILENLIEPVTNAPSFPHLINLYAEQSAL